MNLKKIIKSSLKQFGISIKRTKFLPFGEDMFVDLQRLFDKNEVKVVFDVGANVGQSCIQYLQNFPVAKIHSFEPIQ
jgi:trans-aconitate methyltransferase